MRPFKWILLIGIAGSLTLIAFKGYAQNDEFNPEPIEIREFSESKLDDMRTDQVYDYSVKRGEGTTLWDRFVEWIQGLLGLIFASNGVGVVARIVLYLLIIGAIVLSLLKLLNANPATIFGRTKEKNLPYTVYEENIHEIDFDQEIEQAQQAKDFRLATRLYYLKSLKFLTDRDLLKWEPGKTNAQYFYELQAGRLRTDFTTLSHLFEYAWYGGFSVDTPVMQKAYELSEAISSSDANNNRK